MSGDSLKDVLDGARPQLEAGLVAAEAELEQLEFRRTELLALINQAKAALGLGVTAPLAANAGARALTLHEGLAQVLREHENEWMTVRELTDQVNARSLYRKRDGSPVETNQVHARTKRYNDLFEKAGSRIRLRSN